MVMVMVMLVMMMMMMVTMNDDDNDYGESLRVPWKSLGFIWGLLERPGAQMLCFTMNSSLTFKTIEIEFVLKVRQGASAEIEPRWAPPTEPLAAQVSS